jgi:hypothetical protein
MLFLNDYSIIINPRAVTPSANRGDSSFPPWGCLTTLGRAKWGGDASLSLGRTKWRTFLNSPIIKSTLGKV